jgi:hypothetical protein
MGGDWEAEGLDFLGLEILLTEALVCSGFFNEIGMIESTSTFVNNDTWQHVPRSALLFFFLPLLFLLLFWGDNRIMHFVGSPI